MCVDSRRRWLPLALLAVMAILVIGCGSDDDGGDGGGGSGSDTTAAKSDGAAAAEAALKPYLELPTELTVTEPLKERPEPGESVYYIGCGQPVCEEIYKGISAGADALGWKSKQLVVNQADPSTVNSAVLQATQDGATIIIQSGNQQATFEQGLKAAKDADILFVDGQTDNPVAEGGVDARVAPTSMMLPQYGQLVADQIAADSDGSAKVAIVRVPTYDPIFQIGFDEIEKVLGERCPEDCRVDTITVNIQDFLKGQLTGKVVSYLQAHPDVKYLVFGFGSEEIGMVSAAQEASLDVKLTGFFPDPAQQEEIAAGDSMPWPGAPLAVEGWQFIDSAARLRQGMDAPDAGLPVWMITADNLEDPKAYAEAPVDYEQQFRKLWQVD